MYFYVIIIVAIVVDLATKIAVRMNLEMGEMTERWGGFIRFTHIANTGSTGNMFHGLGRLFAFLAFVIVGIILYMRSKGKFEGPFMQAGAALIIGGAVGNAIDRIIYNQVTDFLYFSYNATMNFADIWVFAGIVLILSVQVVRLFKPAAVS